MESDKKQVLMVTLAAGLVAFSATFLLDFFGIFLFDNLGWHMETVLGIPGWLPRLLAALSVAVPVGLLAYVRRKIHTMESRIAYLSLQIEKLQTPSK